MPSFQLHFITVPAFNVIRFLLVSVILIPLFEASIANLFRIACALHLLRGNTARWRESRLGYLSMHGKYYSRSSRAFLYIISIATLGMYFILESSTSAELHPQLSTVEVRKTVALDAGKADLETWKTSWRAIAHSSTKDLVAASIRHTGQRRGKVHRTALRKKAREEDHKMTDYCFEQSESRNNGSLLLEELQYFNERKAAASWNDIDLFHLEYDFTSFYRAAYMGHDDSLLFTLDSDKLAVHLKAQFYAIGRNRADKERVEYLDGFYSKGTPLSSKEFVRRFGTSSIRVTVRRFVWVNRYAFSENRRFKCVWTRYTRDGGKVFRKRYVLCRLSILANRDGAFDTASILEEGQKWGDSCSTYQPNASSGQCLSLLLRGAIVSNFPTENTLTDVLLTDVLGSVEYNGSCALDRYGEELTLAGSEEFRRLLNGTSATVPSVGTLRRLMIRRIVLAEGGKAIARDGYETVRLPLSAVVAPTVNVKFIAIICAVALFIALPRAFLLALARMHGMKRSLPWWVQLLITAQGVKVGNSFKNDVQEATDAGESGDDEEYGNNLKEEKT